MSTAKSLKMFKGSVISLNKVGVIEEDIPAWQKFDWCPKIQHGIYRDWGIYYARVHRYVNALDCFTKAMQLDIDDSASVYHRSQVQRFAAQHERALADAERATAMASAAGVAVADYNFEYCSNLFELNQLETTKIELARSMKLFKGSKAAIFKRRLKLVDRAIKDATGKAMSVFFLKNQKLVERVNEIQKAKAITDDRPLWKIMRELENCDILSVLEDEEEVLSPLEIARRRRAYNILHQTYMYNNWIDFIFMKELRSNPQLFTDYCMRSKGYLKEFVYEQYRIIRHFVKMLEIRSPLYYVNYLKYGNLELFEAHKEAYLFRTQYQINRNMLEHLRQIRKLRKEGRVKKLLEYVEKIMGDYYVIKTNRVMCWKFEFINEVYNTVALALTEQYTIPKNFRPSNMAILQLLHLPSDKIQDVVPFVFGDRSTYVQSGHLETEGKKFRQRVSHLENRIRFTNFSIEKCYLYYLISEIHLSQGHSDECCFIARKACKESKVCNSNIWHFLSVLQILKADIVLHKVERVGEALDVALPLAEKLGEPKLINFIEVCIACNEEELIKKTISANSSHRATNVSAIID